VIKLLPSDNVDYVEHQSPVQVRVCRNLSHSNCHQIPIYLDNENRKTKPATVIPNPFRAMVFDGRFVYGPSLWGGFEMSKSDKHAQTRQAHPCLMSSEEPEDRGVARNQEPMRDRRRLGGDRERSSGVVLSQPSTDIVHWCFFLIQYILCDVNLEKISQISYFYFEYLCKHLTIYMQ